MEWNFLIVELGGNELEATWSELVQTKEFQAKPTYTNSVEVASAAIKKGDTAFVLYFVKDKTPELMDLLKLYQTSMGCLSEFQAIACDEPMPVFMAAVYEFGIEQFISTQTWVDDVLTMVNDCVSKLNDPTTAEAKTVKLQLSLMSGDQKKIEAARGEMGDVASYDFRAAFAQGKAAEATGEYDKAVEAFKTASGMNKMFRPSSTSLGENLLITGKVDEAIAIFEKLDKTNPNDVERKGNLAAAFVEKGDFEKARQYSEQIEKLSPGTSKVKEINAQILLSQGKLGEAFGLLDQMQNVGPFFAAKLNDLGIKLSQAGRGKNALALYQKAHKIVRPELRYKISMNAALACRRLKDFDLALKYVARCEKEFGAMFPKLLKVKQTIMVERKQAAEAAPPAATPKAS